MKIYHKLLLGFLAIALLVALVGVISVANNSQVLNDLTQLTKSTLNEVDGATEMGFALQSSHIAAHDLLLQYHQKPTTADEFDRMQSGIISARSEIEAATLLFERSLASSIYATKLGVQFAEKTGELEESRERAKEFDSLDDIERKFAEYRESLSYFFGITQTDLASAESVLHSSLEPLYRSTLELVRAYESHVEGEGTTEAIEIYEAITTTDRIVTVTALLSFIVALGLAVFISRRLTSKLVRLRDAAREIGEGQLQTRVAIEARDEIGDLANSFNNMATSLQRATDRHQAVEKLTNDGIITIASSGTIKSFNRAAEQLFGYAGDEVIGQNVKILMSEPDQSAHDGYLRQYITTGQAKMIGGTGRELVALRKNGSLFPIHLTVGEMRIDDEQIFAGIVRDISEQQQSVTDLTSARDAAEQASRAKSEFVATMSHEIRTPMNGVIGMVDVLHQTSLKGHQVEMVELIQESANSLLGIIDEILDFSKIEAGKLKIESKPFDVTKSMDSMCHMMNHLAEKEGVELIQFTDPDLPVEVLGDDLRLRQILVNLTNNAIKFSSKMETPGRVSVRATLGDTTMTQVTVEFQVSDNGIGMDKNTQKQLFIPFTQADRSTSRRYGGTGLGLSIVRGLADLMGGSVTIQSARGQGASFTLKIPFPLPPEPRAAREAISDVAGLMCLMVGENQGLSADLATYLTHAGAQVRREADLAAARVWARGSAPGLCVWIIDAGDTHPPVEELQAATDLRPDLAVRLLAVVLERGMRQRPRLKAEGIVTLDGNAMSRRAFLEAVALAAGREMPAPNTGFASEESREQVATQPTREEAFDQGRLILVAEDNETNQKVIMQQLALLGYTADIASDGREAFDRWQHINYALLISDLHMPDMDGYELTEAVRAAEDQGQRPRTPIIAWTANAATGEAEHCREAGMDGYLSKPARLEKLKVVLAQWMPCAASAVELTQAEAANVPAPVDADKQDQPSQPAASPPVNVSVLEELLGGDPEMVQELLQDFRLSAAEIADELRAACQAGDAAATRAAAHKLKSSALSVGAITLGELCEEIESAGKANQSELLPGLLIQFESKLVAVDNYLATL